MPVRISATPIKMAGTVISKRERVGKRGNKYAFVALSEGEAFWLAIRPNLARFADVADWAKVITGPVTPQIDDPAFVAAALALLPETLDVGAWSQWAEAVKQATGAKGRALFMPLRKALTGRANGPEMADVMPLLKTVRAS